MLSLIRAERDQLLKKYSKAKERLLDLDQLKKDKVELEFKLKDMTSQLIEKADKIKELTTAAEVVRKSSKSKPLDCGQCKAHEQKKNELILELSKAEKAVLEIKNEKMVILLEKKDVEEKLRD